MSASAPALDYEAIFRQTPASLLLIAPDGTILDQNERHERDSLRKHEETRGRDFFDVWPPNSETEADEVRRSHDHVRQQREAHTMPLIRYDLSRPDGTFDERYWEATHYPVLAPDGSLQYILQRTQDVTERVLNERRRQEVEREIIAAEQLRRWVLDSLPVLIATTSTDGQALSFNQRWVEFTGRPQEQLLREGWADVIHPDDLERLRAERTRVRQTHEIGQHEFRLRRHDGTYRWMLTRTVPRFDEAGNETMRVSGTVDVDDQKRLVEEVLRANEEQAMLAEEHYLTHRRAETERQTLYEMFQQAPAMIGIVRGADYVFEFVNDRYKETLFPGREIVGRSIAEAVPESAAQGFTAILDDVMRTGTPFEGREVPLRVTNQQTGQERELFLDFTYQPFRESGRSTGILCFAFDVTDRVRQRQQALPDVPPSLTGTPPDASA